MNEVLTFHYKLHDDYGNLLESSYDSEPVTFVTGGQQIIEVVEKRVLPLKIGETVKFRVSSKDIFFSGKKGETKEVEKNKFSKFQRFEIGDEVSLKDGAGQVTPYVITGVGEEKLRLVSCGLMSREDVTFSVELLGRRKITEGEVIKGSLKKMYIYRENDS